MRANRTPAPVETQRFVDMFEEAEEATLDARENSERDRDYYDGNQLTQAEIDELKRRGQPPIIINRIRRKVNWMKGLEAQRQTDPKAFARTPQGEEDAEAATDALRFVSDNTKWDRARSKCWEDLLVEGTCAVEVVHKQARRGVEVVVNRYDWDRVFIDPYSAENDCSDARYLGAVIWSDVDELKAQHPKLDPEAVQWTLDDSSTSETYDDKPKYFIWGDKTRKRVRIVLLYYRENGTWKWAKFHKGAVLEEGKSPYVNEDGESVCPMVVHSLYMDRDNCRYGFVRDLIHPQDEINKRRSKSLHLLTMRQTKGDKGAVDSVKDMKRELARPDGHIEVNPDMNWELLNTNDLASGQMSLLQEAKNEIDLMGANGALQGEESGSGRAVLARQQGGMVEIASDVAELFYFTNRVFEQMWLRIRQFWTEQRWIRVTDDQKGVRFVGLNQPVTLGDQLSEMPEEQAVQFAGQIGFMGAADPRVGQVVGIRNVVSEMDVDIIIEEVPDQVSMDAEQFQAIMGLGPALIQSNPAYAPVVNELLIEVAPGLRSKAKERLREAMEEVKNQGGVDPMAAQMQFEKAHADIRATHAKASRDEASATASLTQPFAAAGA